MPRKTVREAQEWTGQPTYAWASMRPRPDAAENHDRVTWTARDFDTLTIVLQ